MNLNLTEDENEYWEERAAILEYEHGMTREAAEKEAMRRIRDGQALISPRSRPGTVRPSPSASR